MSRMRACHSCAISSEVIGCPPKQYQEKPTVSAVTATTRPIANTPFDGAKFRGGPVGTIVAGEIVWQAETKARVRV